MGVWIDLVLLLFSSAILYFVAHTNYLLFHAIAEGFAIIVAALIYVLATRTYQYSRNNMFLFLGISYLHVAILDFSHLLTYKGMGIFPGFGTDTPTQLWIAGRFMEAASFTIILFLQHKQINKKLVTVIYSFITACLLLSIMAFKVFPTCFVEEQGLTIFKVASEYVIIFLLLGGAYILYLKKDSAGQDILKTIGTAMVITAAAELSFTLYTDVYGIANWLGHMLKVVSYYFIFTGVVAQGIDTPYSLISTELKDRASKDVLTCLYNRQGMVELMEKELQQVEQKNDSLGILMIDLDNFKVINDTYGHLYGDQVLKLFANLLNHTIRENDIACRFGGDEFVVLVRGVDSNQLANVKQRIQTATEAWINDTKKLRSLGISIGTSLLKPGQTIDINNLLKMADQSMYAAKQDKKDFIKI